jgi:hypothetical protein
MLLWESVAYAALGLLVSCAAARIFPLRFSFGPLLLLTGTGAGLTGGLVMYTVLGGGHPAATLVTAFVAACALVSLLAAPPRKGRHARVRSAA